MKLTIIATITCALFIQPNHCRTLTVHDHKCKTIEDCENSIMCDKYRKKIVNDINWKNMTATNCFGGQCTAGTDYPELPWKSCSEILDQKKVSEGPIRCSGPYSGDCNKEDLCTANRKKLTDDWKTSTRTFCFNHFCRAGWLRGGLDLSL